jgi:hypothetical protein
LAIESPKTQASTESAADRQRGLGRRMTRITIVTDAWYPQVNGVVRSIENTNRELSRMGVEVFMVTPKDFANIPCPTYP